MTIDLWTAGSIGRQITPPRLPAGVANYADYFFGAMAGKTHDVPLSRVSFRLEQGFWDVGVNPFVISGQTTDGLPWGYNNSKNTFDITSQVATGNMIDSGQVNQDGQPIMVPEMAPHVDSVPASVVLPGLSMVGTQPFVINTSIARYAVQRGAYMDTNGYELIGAHKGGYWSDPRWNTADVLWLADPTKFDPATSGVQFTNWMRSVANQMPALISAHTDYVKSHQSGTLETIMTSYVIPAAIAFMGGAALSAINAGTIIAPGVGGTSATAGLEAAGMSTGVGTVTGSVGASVASTSAASSAIESSASAPAAPAAQALPTTGMPSGTSAAFGPTSTPGANLTASLTASPVPTGSSGLITSAVPVTPATAGIVSPSIAGGTMASGTAAAFSGAPLAGEAAASALSTSATTNLVEKAASNAAPSPATSAPATPASSAPAAPATTATAPAGTAAAPGSGILGTGMTAGQLASSASGVIGAGKAVASLFKGSPAAASPLVAGQPAQNTGGLTPSLSPVIMQMILPAALIAAAIYISRKGT